VDEFFLDFLKPAGSYLFGKAGVCGSGEALPISFWAGIRVVSLRQFQLHKGGMNVLPEGGADTLATPASLMAKSCLRGVGRELVRQRWVLRRVAFAVAASVPGEGHTRRPVATPRFLSLKFGL
jgi:hypothetical protein